MEQLKPQHIVAISAENVKRLTAVKIDISDPAGSVILSGINGAGKSSVMDSIEMCLRGGNAIPEQPIRRGKEKAVIILKTEDLIVTRKFTKAGTYLEVTNHNGLKYPRPQDLLDGLINLIGFDPMEFANMDAKKQGKRLLDVCPPTIDLDKNASAVTALAEERTAVNRDVKALQARLAAMKVPSGDVPTKEIAISALTGEISKLMEKRGSIQSQTDKVSNLRQRIDNYKAQIEDAEKRLETLKSCKVKLDAEIVEEQNALSTMTDPAAEIKTLQTQIANADAANNKVREARSYNQVKSELDVAVKKSEGFTTQIEALRTERDNALKESKFPVAGLSIDQNGQVVFNSIPLKQCASSEQITVGIALASAANPCLKVAFVKHGSLLDQSGMQTIAEVARKFGMQVWIERVEDNNPAAIQIVDGSNIGVKDEPDAAHAEPKPEELFSK